MAETQFSSSEKEQVDEWTVETVEVRCPVCLGKVAICFHFLVTHAQLQSKQNCVLKEAGAESHRMSY